MLSVRTWLDASKPSDLDMERMGGFEELISDILCDYDIGDERLLRWIEGNAHPWQFLLATGDARLIESATVDNTVNRLWGEVDGRGKNMLGTMLMELRTELRADGTDTATSNIAAA